MWELGAFLVGGGDKPESFVVSFPPYMILYSPLYKIGNIIDYKFTKSLTYHKVYRGPIARTTSVMIMGSQTKSLHPGELVTA